MLQTAMNGYLTTNATKALAREYRDLGVQRFHSMNAGTLYNEAVSETEGRFGDLLADSTTFFSYETAIFSFYISDEWNPTITIYPWVVENATPSTTRQVGRYLSENGFKGNFWAVVHAIADYYAYGETGEVIPFMTYGSANVSVEYDPDQPMIGENGLYVRYAHSVTTRPLVQIEEGGYRIV